MTAHDVLAITIPIFGINIYSLSPSHTTVMTEDEHTIWLEVLGSLFEAPRLSFGSIMSLYLPM